MGVQKRIECQLELALADTEQDTCPPTIRRAMRYAVFPGGARIRPRLCLAVAAACVDDRADNAERYERAAGAAAAIELMHCASLVHDDLPCLDDAAVRRGRAAVHKVFGEPLAVLAGDALIVLAKGRVQHINRPVVVTVGHIGDPLSIRTPGHCSFVRQ